MPFFISVFFSQTQRIHRAAGEGRGPSSFISSTCLQTLRQLFAIMHLSSYLDAIIKMLLNKICPHQGISIWFGFEILHIDLSQTSCEFELTPIITLVLQTHQLAKWARHPNFTWNEIIHILIFSMTLEVQSCKLKSHW